MGWSSNINSHALLDFETAFKTPPGTPAAIKLPFNTLDLKEGQPPKQSYIIGAGRHSAKPWYGSKTVNGNLTGPLDLIAIGYILKMIFGAPTTTGTGPYTHTFKIGTSTPSCVIEKGWPGDSRYYLYTGCKAAGFNISFGQDRELVYTVPIIGAKEEYATSSYDSSPTDVSKPATVFYSPDVVAKEGGSAIDTLEEFSFDFRNNPTLGWGLGGNGEATLYVEGAPNIGGRIRGMFDADTIIAKGRAHTESSLAAEMTSGSYSLKFYTKELEYSHESPVITGPGGAYLDLSFIGFYQNDAAASDFYVELINDQASYA